MISTNTLGMRMPMLPKLAERSARPAAQMFSSCPLCGWAPEVDKYAVTRCQSPFSCELLRPRALQSLFDSAVHSKRRAIFTVGAACMRRCKGSRKRRQRAPNSAPISQIPRLMW